MVTASVYVHYDTNNQVNQFMWWLQQAFMYVDIKVNWFMWSLQQVFMYIDNQVYYGDLVNSDNFETTHLHNDLYSIIDNKQVILS